jgi:hypothetical protein
MRYEMRMCRFDLTLALSSLEERGHYAPVASCAF